MARRIGVFGGTFDPIHNAHLAVGAAARHQLHLDEVRFVVANIPWQKAKLRRISSAHDRFAMVSLSVAGRPGLLASDLEIRRGGDSFTADTLRQILDEDPHDPHPELFLIVGSDLVDDLPTWQRWTEIPQLCTLAVAYRPGEESGADLAPGWRSVEVRLPALELSSTELREMAADGRPLDFLVPDSVIAYVADHGLYR